MGDLIKQKELKLRAEIGEDAHSKNLSLLKPNFYCVENSRNLINRRAGKFLMVF